MKTNIFILRKICRRREIFRCKSSFWICSYNEERIKVASREDAENESKTFRSYGGILDIYTDLVPIRSLRINLLHLNLFSLLLWSSHSVLWTSRFPSPDRFEVHVNEAAGSIRSHSPLVTSD